MSIVKENFLDNVDKIQNEIREWIVKHSLYESRRHKLFFIEVNNIRVFFDFRKNVFGNIYCFDDINIDELEIVKQYREFVKKLREKYVYYV